MFHTAVLLCKHSIEVMKWSVFLKFKLTNRFTLGDIFFSALYFLLIVFYNRGKKLVKSGRHKNTWCPFCPMMPSQFYDPLGDYSDCLSVVLMFPLKQYWSFDVLINFFQKVRQFGGVMTPPPPLGQHLKKSLFWRKKMSLFSYT